MMGRKLGSRNKKKIIDNKKPRTRKVKIEEINPETVTLMDKPSNSFCEACKNTDIRIVKDNMNLAITTLCMVAFSMDMEYSNIESLCKKLKKWSNEELNRSLKTKLRKQTKEGDDL
jgi:hypothetical protein